MCDLHVYSVRLFLWLLFFGLFYPNLVCLCFILFYYYSLEICLFSKERQKHVDLDGRETGEDLGGVGGEKTVIGTYSMEKDQILIKIGINKASYCLQ